MRIAIHARVHFQPDRNIIMISDWRRQVSQDAAVTKGGIRIAWFLMEQPGFAEDGWMLDYAAISAETGMHPHSVANAITILRGFGHIACRGVKAGGQRRRLIHPVYQKAWRDAVVSQRDMLEDGTVPSISDLPMLDQMDQVMPESTSSEQVVVPVSNLDLDAAIPLAEQADPKTVSSHLLKETTAKSLRNPSIATSISSELDSGDSWARDLKNFKLPQRCQHLICDRPAAFLCLENKKGFCRQHHRHAIIPVSLSQAGFSEI
ncbi:hypothetical protein [Methylobacterium sp. A52T]